ncbi:MAG TPA: AraC family transcriptional regulator [Acetobacteraceae bacterium]|nr:AraC family transcriptional regulator [Acetobacteraceae bacterium]
MAGTALAPITGRLLGAGPGWRASEFVCRAGPGDPVFEERHEKFGIAAVVEGSFGYRGEHGRALLHPGALMLGNAGACYACAHEHAAGDRCLSIQVEPALFEEIAAFVARSARFRFTAPMLPSGLPLMRAFAALEAAEGLPAASLDAAVLTLIEAAVATSAGVPPRREPCPPADERRVTRALRRIEAEAEDALDLDTLAAEAGMSRYHFLRRFRAITGRTPYRYLLDQRLRRAAVRLRRSRESVAAIAFGAGFGDLSTFNAQFRAAYGQAPREWRDAASRLSWP